MGSGLDSIGVTTGYAMQAMYCKLTDILAIIVIWCGATRHGRGHFIRHEGPTYCLQL